MSSLLNQHQRVIMEQNSGNILNAVPNAIRYECRLRTIQRAKGLKRPILKIIKTFSVIKISAREGEC